MNSKQNAVRRVKAQEKMTMLRKEMWPAVSDDAFWHRNKHRGFTTIPRTMPILMKIIDELTKNQPCGQTYLALWCRAFDEPLLTIENPKRVAAEAGFGGERALSTWHQRMKMLQELGFIDAREGDSGAFHYVLIFNPHLVVQQIKSRIQQPRFMQLLERAMDIGATDLQKKEATDDDKTSKPLGTATIVKTSKQVTK